MSDFKIVSLFAVLTLVGIFSIPRLSVDLNPNYNLPKLTITFSLVNSSAEVVEQEVTGVLENALSQISDIEKIYSISQQGKGAIEIAFDTEVDLEFKKFEVSSILRQIYPKLNSQITYPLVEQSDRTQEGSKALLIYSISSNSSTFKIRRLADEIIVREISQIPGIKEVVIIGGETLEISVLYDFDKLKLYGIQPKEIQDAIENRTFEMYPGSIQTNSGQKLLIRLQHSLTTIEEIERTPIRGKNLLVKDLAKVVIGETKPQSYFRINGLNAVTLAIFADDHVNRLVFSNNIKEKLLSLERQIAGQFSLQLQYDDTEFLRREVDKNFIRTSFSILFLFLFVLFAYRKWRHVVILFLGMISTMSLTMLVSFILKMQIHLYTLAGLTIALGMVVDNVIVILDHLSHKKTGRVFAAIAGATLNTLVAFLLVLSLPEEERYNLTEFCEIISVALVCSIIVSVYFVPALYSKLFTIDTQVNQATSISVLRRKVRFFSLYSGLIVSIASFRRVFIGVLVFLFGIPVFLLPSRWEGQKWYNATIGTSIYQERIRPYADMIMGGTLRLFIRNVYDKSGYREPQRVRLYVYANLPFGNTLEEMNRLIRNIEDNLSAVNGVDTYISEVWSGQDARITIMFDKVNENGHLPYALKQQLIARSLDWGGVSWNIFGVGQEFSNSFGESLPKYKVELRGYNFQELSAQAVKLAEKLRKHPRVQNINTNERLSWTERPSKFYTIDFDWHLVGGLGVSPGEIIKSINEDVSIYRGLSSLAIGDSRLPISFKSNVNLTKHDLMEKPRYLADRRIDLNPFAFLSLSETSSTIHKEDRQYIRVLAYDYYGSHKFGDEYLENVLKEIKKELPPGYSAKSGSWTWDWEKAKRHYGLVLLMIVCVFLLCSIIFENFLKPFLIISTIPISFIGIFLTFSTFGFYFDQGGYAAFLMLGGLAVNGSIHALHGSKNFVGNAFNRCLLKSFTQKVKPILLSVLSTCLGLLPFTLGGQKEVFWFSFAVGTIGGLIFSLFSIFVVLPALAYRRENIT